MLKISLSAFALVAFVLTSCAQTNMDVHHANSAPAAAPSATAPAVAGRALFLKNCAHCHGVTAHGDDGPDLHKLDFTDEWLGNRIRNGKAGEMTAFAGKLKPAEIDALIAYLHTLK